MKKNFFRLLSLFACLCLIFGSLTMVACNGDATDATEAPTTDAVEEDDGLVEVIRVIDDIKYGGTGTLLSEAIALPGQFREYKFRANFHIPPMSVTIFKKKTAKKKVK